MKHIWSVLCRRSQIDVDNNNISLNEVLEQLNVDVGQKTAESQSEEITIPFEYEIVSLWTKEKRNEYSKAQVVVDFIDPKGKKLKSFEQPAEITPELRRLRTRFRIAGIGLTVPGDYIFIISVKEKGDTKFHVVSELPLEVRINRIPAKKAD